MKSSTKNKLTTSEWLNNSFKLLGKAGIGTARLDALVLLEDVTGIDRAKLLAESGTGLTSVQIKELNNLLNRRKQHEPLAYVRGKSEFYGREFIITPAVLEPRPESETMIEELLILPDLPNNVYIADIGTGSGALGITAKFELPDARIDLIDIDQKALKIAKTNVDNFTLRINVICNDLLDDIKTKYDALLCNLPYVPDDFKINTAAGHEPRNAIFGGQDGLDIYRKLFKQLDQRESHVLYILTESLPTQHIELTKIAKKSGYEIYSKNDFILVFKCIK